MSERTYHGAPLKSEFMPTISGSFPCFLKPIFSGDFSGEVAHSVVIHFLFLCYLIFKAIFFTFSKLKHFSSVIVKFGF